MAVSSSSWRSQGYGPGGAKIAEPFLEQAIAHRTRRVAVVVARDHGHPARVEEELGQSRPRLTELVRQGGRGQVARDQDVVGRQSHDPRDHLVQPFQAELAGPAREQARPSRPPAC